MEPKSKWKNYLDNGSNISANRSVSSPRVVLGEDLLTAWALAALV